MKRPCSAFRADRDHVSSRPVLGLLSLALSAAVLVMLGPAAIVHAQSPVALSAITVEQRVRIENHVRAEHRPSVTAPADFIPAVGATLPLGIELYWMSPAVELNRFRYAVVAGATLIVEPYTRRIVAVWEGSHVQNQPVTKWNLT
jgi:hypothetical protein